MVQKIGDKIIAKLKIPKHPYELISIVPDDWILNNSRLVYPKRDIRGGYLRIEPDKIRWGGFPLENILQNENILPIEVCFNGNKKDDSSFLVEVRDKLIPSFLSKGYKIDLFTAEKIESKISGLGRRDKEIATLHFYRDELSKKWTGVFNCDAEKGMGDLEIFKHYFVGGFNPNKIQTAVNIYD